MKKDGAKRVYSRKRKTPNKKGCKRHKVVVVEEDPQDVIESIEEAVVDEDFTIENVVTENLIDSDKTVVATASTSKVVAIEPEENEESSIMDIVGFRLIDISILSNVFKVLSCPGCKGTDCINLSESGKQGLASTLQLQCEFCLYKYSFATSRKCRPLNSTKKKKEKWCRKFNEVNLRIVYGCRTVGAGYQALRKLCGHLNMPPPMTQDSYDNLSNGIKEAAKSVAEKSMASAAAELRGVADYADVPISLDGSWQKKGYTSTTGVVTAISVDSGKVIDTCILSKHCKGCTQMKEIKKSDPVKFAAMMKTHQCNQNYTGSSPNMEKAGTQKIFGRSVDKHQLYYTQFFGDGDSKAFTSVENVYGPEKKVIKQECIGHYQKRVGNRLRKLKKTNKALGGKANGKEDLRLTDAKIDTLQNYFGIALRQHVGDLDAMVNGCMASMFHVANFHDKCPKSDDTWCQFWRDKIEGTNKHKEKGSLALSVRKAILPIYQDLCKHENLIKCLHGKTQNANESFNGMIWNRVPKKPCWT